MTEYKLAVMEVVKETSRLLLCKYDSPDSFTTLFPILSDAVTMSFWPAPLDAEAVRRWIDKAKQDYLDYGVGRYAAIERKSGLQIGDCGFKKYEIAGKMEVDLGYIIDHKFWNQGLAKEAAAGCLDIARDFQIPRVVANMEVRHQASRKVAESLGFILEKEFINERNRGLPTLLLVWNNPGTEGRA